MTADTIIIPYDPLHLPLIVLQEHQQAFYSQCTNPDYAESLAKAGPAWTAMRGTQVLGIAGIIEHWPGRGTAWALMANDIGSSMTVIHRQVRRVLNSGRWRRVEAAVASDFDIGRTWAAMLGFVLEKERAEFYLPDGGSAALYAFTWRG